MHIVQRAEGLLLFPPVSALPVGMLKVQVSSEKCTFLKTLLLMLLCDSHIFLTQKMSELWKIKYDDEEEGDDKILRKTSL